jgi:hypothetical protein
MRAGPDSISAEAAGALRAAIRKVERYAARRGENLNIVLTWRRDAFGTTESVKKG